MAVCETTVRPMDALWHLIHMDMENVSMMSGTSLTMPSRHLSVLYIRRDVRALMDCSCLNQKRGVSETSCEINRPC
jgi:hypothetical protein